MRVKGWFFTHDVRCVGGKLSSLTKSMLLVMPSSKTSFAQTAAQLSVADKGHHALGKNGTRCSLRWQRLTLSAPGTDTQGGLLCTNKAAAVRNVATARRVIPKLCMRKVIPNRSTKSCLVHVLHVNNLWRQPDAVSQYRLCFRYVQCYG